MKTSLFTQSWRALSSGGALVWAAAGLLLAGSAHATSVTTITGGPSALNPNYYGYVDGDTAQVAQFHTPIGLCLDSSANNLFVADRDNNAIRELNISGNYTTTFTTYGLNKPVGVVVDSQNNVYVLNHGNGSNGTVLLFDQWADYLGTLASGLVNANGIAMDSVGNIYVTAAGNKVLQISVIQTYPALGSVTTNATITAAGTLLQGITVTFSGYLAVVDYARNGGGVILVDPTTGIYTNLTGFNGVGDHFGPKAFVKFAGPMGITAAGGNLLVVSDYGNNRVKVVDGFGTVTNLYGVNSNYWVTGPNTWPGWYDGNVATGDASYNIQGTVESRLPAGVFFSKADGNVYTTEDYYHLIRKVTGSGLPLPPPPPAPVPAPAIGWVLFTPPSFPLSALQTGPSGSTYVFNNDVMIDILSSGGTMTHFTYGATPSGIDTIPNPSPTNGFTPPGYVDGTPPGPGFPDIIASKPDFMSNFTVKAIGFAAGRPSSAIVSAQFQFKAANPLIVGDNAAWFQITEQTTNAVVYYTIDGSDPVPDVGTTVGPLSVPSGTNGIFLSLNASSDITFKVMAVRSKYQNSDIVAKTFLASAFIPNSMSFGFSSGEASSDFVGSPGQLFYAPVTLSPAAGTRIDSLQFNITVTNGGWNPGPAITPGAYTFMSMLVKPDPANKGVYLRIPPYMFTGVSSTNPAPTVPNNTVIYNGGWFEDLRFVNSSLNLMGVGWLERQGQTNLYDTGSQDLIQYSMAHDTMFGQADGKVILGGYAFRIPSTALPGQTYQIQLGRPSATTDGIGDPGSDVYIALPATGSLTNGAMNSVKVVTAGQRKYLVGDASPFRWFNAGDYGDFVLNNADVMQIFQSAVYGFNYPMPGSDFYDSMDSCGALGTDTGNGYYVAGTPLTDAQKTGLFDGNDTLIDQIAFGDGNLDVCDVYVTFRRSLDPSRTLWQRFWTNGVLGASTYPVAPLAPPPILARKSASVNFAAGDIRATAGQTLQIPVTASVFGSYPLRVLMLGVTVVPLDGSPALTAQVQFTPNAALGTPTLASSNGKGNYAATWLNSTIAGLSGNAVLGTLTVTVPSTATASSAYAVHFDHASASPNGIAPFPKQTTTGLILLADRSSSIFGDAIPDSWRLRYFGTVYNILSQASADADGDGMNNYQEYVAGTDPTDAASLLRSSTTKAGATSPQDCVLHWPSVAGKQYIIERSSSLFGGAWSSIVTNTGTGGTMEYHDTTGGNVRYYRVRVGP